MLDKEKKYKMYDGIIDGDPLTLQKLNEYGYNLDDINELVKNGILEKTQEELYIFKAADDIYHYGMKLLRMNMKEKANLCFEKCYELNPDNLSNCFRVFFKSVMIGNYDKSIELLRRLYKGDNEYYRADYNYYFYLLSILTDMPNDFKEYASKLKLSDIIVLEKDKRYDDISSENDVRKAVMEGKYLHASKLLKSDMESSSRINVQKILSQTLIFNICSMVEKDKSHILELTKQKEYEEIVRFLTMKSNRNKLNLFNKGILNIAQMIIQIKESGIIPTIEPVRKDSIFLAINNHAYTLALNLCIKHNMEYGNDNSSNVIYLLLNDICQLISELEEKKKQEHNSLFSKNIDDDDIYYIKNECEKICDEKPMVLIGPFTMERLNIFIQILTSICNVNNFVVGKDDKLYIVLSKINEHVDYDVSKASELGKKAYWDGNYDECIQQFNYFLQLKKPNSYVFALLGLSYMKKGNNKEAIDYLIVADFLAKKESRNDIDYTGLISQLRKKRDGVRFYSGPYLDFEKKTYAKVNEKEFTEESNYGIDNFNQIDNLVVEFGMDVESACKQLGMDLEKINIVRLLYAKEYYIQKHFQKGDEFLKAVEMSGNKSAVIVSLLNEIRSRKKIYANRATGKVRKLSLTTKPRCHDNNSSF